MSSKCIFYHGIGLPTQSRARLCLFSIARHFDDGIVPGAEQTVVLDFDDPNLQDFAEIGAPFLTGSDVLRNALEALRLGARLSDNGSRPAATSLLRLEAPPSPSGCCSGTNGH